MSMTKKHFELVAEAIQVERCETTATQADMVWNAALNRVADNLAAQFQMINPRFDRERFIAAAQRDTK